MKQLFAILILFTVSFGFGQNDNPYAEFGYEGNTIKTPQERMEYMLIIPNQDTLSVVNKIGIEPKEAKYYLFDKENNIVFQDTLTIDQTSRFFSVDPLAKDYPHNAPYAFSENRVLDAIELEGLEAVLTHGTFAERDDKALFSMDKADYKGGSTWDRVFSQRIAIYSGWNSDSTYEFTWSGANNAKERAEGGAMLAHRLMSEDNPYRKIKHATLVGHSHGGNVNKVAKNILEENGWTVDIINISTPQRKDFQQNDTGKGTNLNFYSTGDLVQFLGVDDYKHIDNRGSLGARKDPKSKNNKIGGANLLVNWFSNALGHSYHNDVMSQRKIEKIVKKEFKHIKPNQNAEKVDNP